RSRSTAPARIRCGPGSGASGAACWASVRSSGTSPSSWSAATDRCCRGMRRRWRRERCADRSRPPWAERRPPAAAPGQVTMVTGTGVPASTFCDTEPSSTPLIPLVPRDPITITSALRLAAAFRMFSATSPTSSTNSTFTFLRASSFRAGPSIRAKLSAWWASAASAPILRAAPGNSESSTATTVSVPLRKALHSASACWSARVLASLPSTGTRIFIVLHPPREHGFYAGASPAGVARRAPGACTDPGEARRRRDGLLLDEGALEYVIARGADARRGGEPAPVQERAEVGQHLWAAADHGAVPGRVERLKA